MTILNKFSTLLTIFAFSSQLFASGTNSTPSPLGKNQFEVSGVQAPSGQTLLSWMDDYTSDSADNSEPWRNDGYYGDWRCVYSTKNQNDSSWVTSKPHIKAGFHIAGNPTVTTDDAGNLYVVCMSVKTDYSEGVLEITSSIDGGKTWSDWQVVTHKVNGIPDKPWISADKNGHLNLVFSDVSVNLESASIKSNIVLMKSVDGGGSWSAEQTLSNPSAASQGAFVHTANDKTIVTWGGYAGGPIYISESSRGDSSFSSPIVISQKGLEVPITQVVSADDGNTLVVLWYEAHDFSKVYFSKSTDGGRSWSDTETIVNKGSLASGVITDENFIVVLNTFENNIFDMKKVVYSLKDMTRLSSGSLLGGGVTVQSPEKYLGGYQTLFSNGDGSYQLFGIDWSGPVSKLKSFFID